MTAAAVPLDWLRLRKLLLPMRRKSPGPVLEAPCEELGVTTLLLLLVDVAPSLLPSRLLMLLLRPKNLRRLMPLDEAADAEDSTFFGAIGR